MSTTETDETLTIREGDVYRFSYHPEVLAKFRGDPYWCFDGQVVARKGRLLDTYWMGASWSESGDNRVVNPLEGTLTFVCNLGDVQRIEEWEQRYYADEDVLNLSYQHGCYKRFAVRNGTQRSAAKMQAWLRALATQHRREIEFRVRQLEQIAVQLSKVEAGDTSISIG